MKLKGLIKDQYYAKLSISIIAYSMIMVVFLSLVFSNIYSKSLYDKIIGDNLSSVGKMNTGLANLNTEMDQIYMMLQMDINVFTYLNQSTDNSINKFNATLSADKIAKINPYVDSVILVNMKTKDYLELGNQGFDPASIVNMRNRDLKKSKTGLLKRLISSEAMIDDNGLMVQKHIVSVIYNELSSDKNEIENMVIINLDWNDVQAGILLKPMGTNLICDSSGNLITYFDNVVPGQNSSFADYFKKISKSDNEIHSLSLKLGSKREIVTFAKNNACNWVIVNIRAYHDIVGDFQNKRNVVIAIALVVLLVCIILGYVLSKLLYSPIGKIADMFKHSKYADGIHSGNELLLISEVSKEVLKQVVHLEEKNENYIPKIKEDFLRNLLSHGVIDGKLDQQIKDYQVGITFTDLYVVAVKIDYDEMFEHKNKNIFETTTIISILKLLEEDFKCEAVNMYSGELCLLLNHMQGEIDIDILVSYLEHVKGLIEHEPGIYVTIGIGGTVHRAEECPDVYKTAQDMLKYKFVLGYNKVIHQNYIDENLTTSFNYSKEIEKKLISSINMNSREDFVQDLESIVSTLKNYNYHDSVIIFLRVALESIRTMNKANTGVKPLKVDFEGFNLMFSNLQTLEQVKDWMVKLFDEHQTLLMEIESVKDNKYYEMVDEIKRYIEENYSDVNLGVEMLAEKTSYTPNYFAKIFKNITDQYVSDYIKQVRIQKAKELLRNSNHSISDISGMAGFVNATYFYSAFRKDVGLTPSSYRNCKAED